MIFIHEGEGTVGADAVGKFGIAAGDEHEMTFEFAFLVERTGTVDFRVKAIVGTELREKSSFRQKLCRGGGDEKFFCVVSIDDLAGCKIEELDAEVGARKFGAVHHFLNASSESVL